ncbi:MAG: radical SAM family heme chaperone HemW [Acidobacteria bacterium]|nr:radical SAM family heme chaperone HemW [Acidobacteriota bacterium]
MPAGVYLHIPFCKSRCSYCDFATDVWRSGDAVERYVSALCAEVLSHESGVESKSLHAPDSGLQTSDSIYFGGGTPSLLTPPQVEKILNSLSSVFSVANDAEITMEMNPATVTPETLRAYRELGINRASFGVQTFNDRDLKLLARGHDADDARNTFKMLRDAGFDNISLDLIAGLPGQTLEDWSRNLEEAIAMQPEHISLYLLEIHEGTPLANQIKSERRPLPDEDLAAEMYEVMLERLAVAGYKQYEISNFSRPGFASRHNTKYWRLEPVYGFGVSAHSFDGRERYANERDTAKYIQMIGNEKDAEVFRETPDVASEYIFLGLRLTEGVSLSGFRDMFGKDILSLYADDIGRIINAGLVEVSGDRMRLTKKGMLYSNEVFEVFV